MMDPPGRKGSYLAMRAGISKKWPEGRPPRAADARKFWPTSLAWLRLRSKHTRATSSSRQKGSTVKKARKNYSPQEKVAILRSHLVDKVSAPQLCAQFQLQPKI